MLMLKGAGIHRRSMLAASAAVVLLSAASVRAADVSGDLVLLDWASGNEQDMIRALEEGFMKAYPNVHFKEINLTTQGDQRGAIRAALQSGEKADLFVNTWPAFRKELADANMLRDLGPLWESAKIGENLSDSWKALGSTDGKLYGITYTFGDRSAMFYKTDTMKKAGIDKQPANWDEFIASLKKLKDAGITPIAVGAKVWSHTEWFESIYEHLNGVQKSSDLAAHKIPWTDASVKNTLKKWAELLKAGCCGSAESMLAMDWDNASDAVFLQGTYGYQMIGMWNNDRARSVDKLKEGVDYSIQQFPAMGAGYDNVSSVDSKEFSGLTGGSNPAAADAFLAWVTTADAANIIASHGLASPSNKVDKSLYGPVMQASANAVATANVQFVLGDLLPGDLVDEYRVQLQKFLQDPSDANIDAVTQAIEAKAKTFD
ncbi:MAG TPA: ABC transporter substrate-binding protein [Bauldia sp.]|nr:ABC transporter substrate-binding protein [Bauldia sp.]